LLRVLLHHAVWGLGLLAAMGHCLAGTAAGVFDVRIVLDKPGHSPPPTGLCISSTLSAQTNAIVRVVCATGQFVSIESAPGSPFVGTHGGAHRYILGTAVPPSLQGEDDLQMGAGTVTALRVINLNAQQDRLELWVSF
jgi:hypothetical protein